MEKKKLKGLINILVIVICTILALFLLLRNDGIEVFKSIGNAKWIFIIIAVCMQIFVAFLDSLILLVQARHYKHDYTFKESYINNLVGQFFCYITPGATGGQFAQVSVFKKQKIEVQNACSILVINYFSFAIVIIIYGLITILFNYRFMVDNLATFNLFGSKISFLVVAILGLFFYLILGGGILILSFSKLATKLVLGIYKLLYKMKIVKNYEKKVEGLKAKVEEFRTNIKSLKNMKGRFFIMLALQVLRFSLQFAIPYFCILAIGYYIEPGKLLIVVSLCCYLMLANCVLPIPGSSGSSELFFIALYSSLFVGQGELVRGAMLLWRAITFYFPLLYTGILTLFYNRKAKNKLDYIPTKYAMFFYNDLNETYKEELEKVEVDNNYF